MTTMVQPSGPTYGSATYQNRLRRPVWLEGIGAPTLRYAKDVLQPAAPPPAVRPELVIESPSRILPRVFAPSDQPVVTTIPTPSSLPPAPPGMPDAPPGAEPAPPMEPATGTKIEVQAPVWKPPSWLWVGVGIAGTVTAFTIWWLVARKKKD